MRQAIMWTNANPIYWLIYAALGRDELKHNTFLPPLRWRIASQVARGTLNSDMRYLPRNLSKTQGRNIWVFRVIRSIWNSVGIMTIQLTPPVKCQNDTTILTHRGRVTHICVNKLTNIGSDNGLSPDRRQAIIWTKVGKLLLGPLVTNFSEILIENHTFSFM